MRTRLSTTSSPRHALRRLLLAASLALLACLALPALAQAATVTWNYMGDVSNDWDLGANWAGGQVPGPDDYVVINDPPPGGTARVHCPHSLTLKGIDVGGLFGAVTLTIDGDLTLTQGTSFVRPVGLDRVTGTLTNEAASTLVIQGDYNDNLGTDTVVNYGTIIGRQDPRVSVGPSLGAPLYNHGSVYCDSGRLWLYQGGIGYPSSSFGGGAGIVQMAAGAGGVSGWTLQNGCALLGGAELQTTTAVPDGATVTCQGSNVVNGGLLGPGTLRVEPGSTLTIANNSGFDAGITLDNDGTVVVNTGTGHQWRGGTLLDNSGVLDLQSNAGGLTVDLTAGRARLVNTGTITSEGTGPVIELALDNQGTINVPSGTLYLQAGTSVPATGDFLGSGTGRVSFETTTTELADGAKLQNVNVTTSSTLVVRPSATVTMEGANTTSGSYPRIEGPGTLRLLAGATLTTSGYPTFGGGLHFDVEGTLVENSNTAETTWEAGTVLDNSGTIDLQADVYINASRNNGAGTIINSGTIINTGGTGTSMIGLALTNTGTISVPTGRLTLPAGKLTNYDATAKTLTGGIYSVTAPGLLRIDNADVTTLAADVRLSGAAARIEDLSGRNALRNLASIVPDGYLGLDGGQALTTVPLTNRGQVWIGETSSLTAANGAYAQAAGQTVLGAQTATLAATGTGAEVRLTGGFLSGCGTVSPSLTNSGGYLKPEGAAPCATLSVAGPYSQGANGQLFIDVAGPAAGSCDVLAVFGSATLGGQLVVTRARSYAPVAGDSFAVLTAATRSGTFARWRSPRRSGTLPAPFTYEFLYAGTGLTLEVVDYTAASPARHATDTRHR